MKAPSYVAPGQPFRPQASDWNAFVDAARASQRPRTNTGPAVSQPRDRASILAENIGTVDVPRWGAVALQAPIIAPADNSVEFERRVAMKCRVPTAVDVSGMAFVGIALEPIGVGKIGRCAVHGVTQAIIDVLDEAHRFAAIADGEALLQSSATGAIQIVWKEAGVGVGKRAIVVFGAAGGGPRFLRVIDNASFATNRWVYTLEDLDDPDITVQARNTMEDGNTSTFAGPSYDLTLLPAGFQLLPIGQTFGGDPVECVVPARLGVDEDGDPQWLFCQSNVVDGECEGGGVGGGGDAMKADGLDQFAPTTSAEFDDVITDGTGTGAVVFSDSPTLVTPILGDASATSLTLTNDLTVANGGTGASTFTDGGVIIGNAAGALQATAAGSVEQVLRSNGAGVDPTFAYRHRQFAANLTADGTPVANTTTPTILNSSTVDIGASMNAVGRMMRITWSGRITATASPTFAMKVMWNSTTLLHVLRSPLSSGAWVLSALITTRTAGASGTLQCTLVNHTGSNGFNWTLSTGNNAVSPIDLTDTAADIRLEVTFNAANASNTIFMTDLDPVACNF